MILSNNSKNENLNCPNLNALTNNIITENMSKLKIEKVTPINYISNSHNNKSSLREHKINAGDTEKEEISIHTINSNLIIDNRHLEDIHKYSIFGKFQFSEVNSKSKKKTKNKRPLNDIFSFQKPKKNIYQDNQLSTNKNLEFLKDEKLSFIENIKRKGLLQFSPSRNQKTKNKNFYLNHLSFLKTKKFKGILYRKNKSSNTNNKSKDYKQEKQNEYLRDNKTNSYNYIQTLSSKKAVIENKKDKVHESEASSKNDCLPLIYSK